MLSSFFKKFSDRYNRKYIERVCPIAARVNEIEQSYNSLTDEQLRAKTDQFRARFKQGETLDQLLPEAFAAVKNAACRLVGKKIVVYGQEITWDMVHFDVQIIGGIALHEGRIAEMATGEGKTLVATLPLYLNALVSKNSQLVTVNDYLARRDSEWMAYLYNFLGLTVGCIQQQMSSDLRREMYGRDITYGTASEFGFDYLRDNGIAMCKDDQVQRGHWYCIVDEIDSVLIDEARTPLVISGPAPIEREQPFTHLKPLVERLLANQIWLVNKLVKEATNLLGKKDIHSEDRKFGAMKMLQVKLGMPKNKHLLRLMETPEWRKLLDKTAVEMNSDFNKEQLYKLKEELFFTIDEHNNQADLTEVGRNCLRPDDSDAFVLPDLATEFIEIEKRSDTPDEKERAKLGAQQRYETVSEEIHSVSQLLRAYTIYERDVEYVVQNGKIMIVDENTGRVMPGRRWSEGLHQAVEAKENVNIEREMRTYATVTIQNYFRMHEKLAGMTGTAETEAAEFNEIYKLPITRIPTNKPCVRVDKNDSIFKTRRDKYAAVVEQIQEAHQRSQPVLIGTVTVEQSEVLSRMLRRSGITHTVLNAKFHQQEAEIVTRAGQRGAVTIATNMAGRGTDIKLGSGVRELGGLFVVGTERHESRRIDRQLRGRCSRQGDLGVTKFFLSLEDDLMRLFLQGNLASKIMEESMKEGEELEHPWLHRSIESAQKKVEQQNFAIRKRLLQYDDVLNKQREVVYSIRSAALYAERAKGIIFEMIEEEVVSHVESLAASEREAPSQLNAKNFVGWLNAHFPISTKVEEFQGRWTEKAIVEEIVERIHKAYTLKESFENPQALGGLERYIVVNAIDCHWQEHLTEMEELRRSVGLRSYGQKDPLSEYKSEAFRFFEELINNVRLQICTSLFRSATNSKAFENLFQALPCSIHIQNPAAVPTAIATATGVAPVPRSRPEASAEKKCQR